MLSTIPVLVAFAQDIEKPPARILIKAKCAFPDGTVVAQQLIEVDASLSAAEKRAVAERACQPIMDEAAAKCDDLATRVDALKSEWRLAAPLSFREHQLASRIRKALEAAPAYCK
jgi:hypothetical protein